VSSFVEAPKNKLAINFCCCYNVNRGENTEELLVDSVVAARDVVSEKEDKETNIGDEGERQTRLKSTYHVYIKNVNVSLQLRL